MKSSEAKAEIVTLLNQGMAKNDVFEKFSNSGIKESKIAYYIASWVSDERRRKWQWLATTTAAIFTLVYIIRLLFFYFLIIKKAPLNDMSTYLILLFLFVPIFAAIGVCIFGLYKLWPRAYMALFFLLIVGIWQSFKQGGSTIEQLIDLVVAIVLCGLLMFTRSKIWPDLQSGLRKVKGKYVFTEEKAPNVSGVFS